MFFDTHAHLNFKAFDKDRDEVVKRTLAQGVFFINVGSDYGTSKLAVEIAEKYKAGVYAAIGLHPIHSGTSEKLKTKSEKLNLKTGKLLTSDFVEEFDYQKFKELAKSDKVVAIGETGLDYMYNNQEAQKQVFLEHLKLAQELNLPVIFHCRKAHQELIEFLKSEIRNPKSEISGVVHCFSGRWSQAKQYLDMGLYLGFNGIIYKMDLKEIIKKTPPEKMLIETDCPYLTPPEAKMERNEPLNVKYIAQRIAEIRGEPLEKITEITTQNVRQLFDI